MGYRLNRLDETVSIAVSNPLLTEFGIHLRLESCERALPLHQRKTKHFIAKLLLQPFTFYKPFWKVCVSTITVIACILKLIKLKNIAFTIFLLSCFQNWPSVSNQVCSLFEAIKKHCSKQSQNSVLKALATQDSRPHPSIEVNAAVYLFSSHSFGLLQCYAAFNDYSKRPL